MPPKGWKKPAPKRVAAEVVSEVVAKPVAAEPKGPPPAAPPSDRSMRLSIEAGMSCDCCECGRQASVRAGDFSVVPGSDGLMLIFRCVECATKAMTAFYAGVSENGRKYRAAKESA